MVCNVCKIDKPLSDYYKDENHPCGYKVRCKICIDIAKRNSPKTREYFEKNKKEIYERHKRYRNRPEVRERILAKKKEWRENNKDKVRIYDNEYKKRKKKHDLNYRLKSILRSTLSSKIRKTKNSPKTVELLGCTIDFFRQYLESKFLEGMNWSNYGLKGWHIDHKYPCSKFDLSKIEDQKKCFHYSNLQPMWAIDNILKSNKL